MKATPKQIAALELAGATLGPSMDLPKSGRRNKYGARRVRLNGLNFASRKEARRYEVLKAMENAGEIVDLECHPVFPLIVNGVLCGRYTADFRYNWCGKTVVEDVKGGRATSTEAYKLRKRIVEALYGIQILEV